MSFVDELNNMKVDDITSEKVNDIVNDMVDTIKKECKAQAKKGNHSISGYVKFTDPNSLFIDNGNEFVESLPRVIEHRVEPTIRNGLKKFSIFGHNITEQSKWEERIYHNIDIWYTVSINDRGFAEQVKDLLNVKLLELGFRDYKLNIQAAKDVIRVHKEGVNKITKVRTESVERMVRPGNNLYIIKVDIDWQP
jgi:hypothetical protein